MAELETDVQQLQGELERHQIQLREADRDKTRAITELSEQNQRLLEQLSRVSEIQMDLALGAYLKNKDAKIGFGAMLQNMCQTVVLVGHSSADLSVLPH